MYHRLYGILKVKNFLVKSVFHITDCTICTLFLILNASGFGACPALGGTNLQPLLLRVRRALDYQDMPWQLRYIGQPEIGEFLQIKFFSVICASYIYYCLWSVKHCYLLVHLKKTVEWVEQLRDSGIIGKDDLSELCYVHVLVVHNCLVQ